MCLKRPFLFDKDTKQKLKNQIFGSSKQAQKIWAQNRLVKLK